MTVALFAGKVISLLEALLLPNMLHSHPQPLIRKISQSKRETKQLLIEVIPTEILTERVASHKYKIYYLSPSKETYAFSTVFYPNHHDQVNSVKCRSERD